MNRLQGIWPFLFVAALTFAFLPKVHAEVNTWSGGFANSCGLIPLDSVWYYTASDSEYFSRPGIDLKNWEQVSALEPFLEGREGGYEGHGWFRCQILLPDSLTDRPVALVYDYLGQIEIHLNGQLVSHARQSAERAQPIGSTLPRFVPGISIVNLESGIPHTIAVKLNNRSVDPLFELAVNDRFSFWISSPEKAQNFIRRRNNEVNFILVFSNGAFLALATLHLLLFLFNRQAKGNLYYSFFLFCSAALGILVYAGVNSDIVLIHRYGGVLSRFLIAGLLITGLKFTYSIAYRLTPPFLWIQASLALLAVIVSSFIHPVFIFGFFLILLLEMLRATMTAVRRRVEGAWIVLLGMGIFVLTAMIETALQIVFRVNLNTFLDMYGLMCLLLANSIYLSWSVGRMNRELREQIVKIKDLSEQNLMQQQEHQKLELSRTMLESEIEKKKIELKEERKLRVLLSELEESNQQLRETQAQLVQSEKMAGLGMLVAGIAHEINTPIGAVASMRSTLFRAVQILREHFETRYPEEFTDNPKVENALKILEDADRVMATGTERVSNIVRRLKSFARLDEAELTDADLHEGIEDTLLLMHHELKHGVKIIRRYGELPRISCYPAQMNQVFLNLLVNATQAMKGKGTITITTGIVENLVQISIEDTGEGISKDNLKRIFDPGFTTKGVGIGTGLGLSICYRIIDQHRGTIHVESEVGSGTTFTIRIPTDLDKRLEAEANHS